MWVGGWGGGKDERGRGGGGMPGGGIMRAGRQTGRQAGRQAGRHCWGPISTSIGTLDSQLRAAEDRWEGFVSSRHKGVASRSASSHPLHTSARPC